MSAMAADLPLLLYVCCPLHVNMFTLYMLTCKVLSLHVKMLLAWRLTGGSAHAD